MKNIIYILAVLVAFTSCKSKLDKVALDDNPYDAAYTGPKVVKINSISGAIVTLTGEHYNIIHVATNAQYDYVQVYRNGTLVVTWSRSAYAPGLPQVENVPDHTVVVGAVYTYTVKLRYEEGNTQQSDPVVYTTP